MSEMIIQLDITTARYQNTVVQYNKIVSAGLQMGKSAKDDMLINTPDTMLQFSQKNNNNFFHDLREPFNIWLIRAGIRDIVEVTNYYLDEVRAACTLLSNFPEEGEVNQDLINSIVAKDRDEFMHESLPTKIRRLKQNYSLNPELSSSLCSLNSVRNCLVHRFGRVGKEDVNKNGILNLKYSALRIYSNKNGVESPITKDNMGVKGPAKIITRLEKIEKQYRLGELISFTTEEFSDICYSLFIYATQMEEEIVKYAKNKGIKDSSEDSQSAPSEGLDEDQGSMEEC